MSIEKYLDEIRVPDKHPGPLSVKVKYDIKKRLILKRKRRDRYYKIISSCGLLLFLFTAMLLYRPEYAVSINNSLLAGNGKIVEENGDINQVLAERRQSEVPLTDEGSFLGMHRSMYNSSLSGQSIRPVSTNPGGSSSYQIMELSQLQEGTPYIIRKVKDGNNRYIYFINEIASENKPRLPY